MVIARQQAFFGDLFHADRGLATGNIPAPIFYNVVTDAILRKWYMDGATTGMTTKARFYADDGELWDHDPAQLQRSLTDLEDLFRRMGLLINGAKTKALTTLPTVATTRISTAAYKRQMEGDGKTYRARKQLRTICRPATLPCRCEVLRATTKLSTLTYHCHPWIRHPRYRTRTPANISSRRTTSTCPRNALSPLAAS